MKHIPAVLDREDVRAPAMSNVELLRRTSFGQALVELRVNGELACDWYFGADTIRSLYVQDQMNLGTKRPEEMILHSINQDLRQGRHGRTGFGLMQTLRSAANRPPNEYVKEKKQQKNHNG